MTKILIISPIPTHPHDSGNKIRVYNMLRTFKEKGSAIHFLYAGFTEGVNCTEMEAEWDQVLYVEQTQISFLKKMATRVKSFFGLSTTQLDQIIWKLNLSFIAKLFKPFQIDDWYDSSMEEKVRSLKEKHVYDVVLVEYVFLSKVFELFGENVLKILDTHDVFADRHLMYVNRGKIPHFFYTTREQELIGLNRADVVLAIQKNEFDYFSNLTRKKVLLVGHICNPLQLEVNFFEETVSLLFIGSGTAPNIDALHYLCNDLASQLVNDGVLFHCNVVGDLPVYTGINQCYFTFFGRVESLEEFYREADIVINPIRIGTGLNVKSIEAISYGKPLITTSLGMEGLEDGKSSAFLVADDPGGVSKCVQRLMLDRVVYQRQVKDAYLYAKKYNSKALGSLMELFKN
jgi:polysaccharide biosynthesis protein PslH